MISEQVRFLKQRRVAKLMTQADLGLCIGLALPVIDSIERGIIKPDKETLRVIEEALDNWNGDIE